MKPKRVMSSAIFLVVCTPLVIVSGVFGQEPEVISKRALSISSEDDLRSKLSSQDYVSASDIEQVIKSLLLAEQESGQEKWPRSEQLIHDMIPYAKDNLLQQAWLHEQAAILLRKEGRLYEADQNYAKAQEILETLNIDAAIRRVENLLNRASLALEQRDKMSADSLFLEVRNYPYYLSKAKNDDMRRLREAHQRAIQGLIITRSGKPDALREIRLIPAMKGFQPLIDDAIKAAEEYGNSN